MLKNIVLFLVAAWSVNPAYAQPAAEDSSFHPYHVNYWATGGVVAGGILLEKLGVHWIMNKRDLTIPEIQSLDRTDVTAFDRWALNFDPTNMSRYVDLSDNVLAGMVCLPALTMLDRTIRRDWLDVLLLYAETQIITNNIYLYAPFGPTFQNRLRPVVYYDALGYSNVRMRGANRSSFYSGHVASGASASFFAAKIYCDYHPELGWKKLLVYGAASVPPLILSYLRLRALAHFPSDLLVGFGVGAACGILIPELHRVRFENTTLGLYSSSTGSGIRLTWRPDSGE